MDFQTMSLGELLAQRADLPDSVPPDYADALTAEIAARDKVIGRLAVAVGIFGGAGLTLVVSLVLDAIADFGALFAWYMNMLGLSAVLMMGAIAVILVFGNERVKKAERDWMSEIAYWADVRVQRLEQSAQAEQTEAE